MSNFSTLFGGGGSIKSIQRGVITIASSQFSGTATITAVNTGKSELRLLGAVPTDDVVYNLAHVVLTNATTVTATRNSSTAGQTCAVSWELTEWN